MPEKAHGLMDVISWDFLIYIDKRVVERICNDRFMSLCNAHKPIPRDRSLLLFIKEFIKEVTEKQSNHLEVLTSIERVLIHKLTRIRNEGLVQQSTHVDSRGVTREIEFMHHYIHHKITIADICEDVGMSASQFSKVFNEETGMSPMNYLETIRLYRAGRMLLGTEKNN